MQEKYRKNDLMYKCTNIQRAYLLGRESHFELGGCSTHEYYEFINQLDIERFEWALNEVIKRQLAMREMIDASGNQLFLENVPTYKIEILDWSSWSDNEIEQGRNEMRGRYEDEVMPIAQWPMFRFIFAKLPNHDQLLFFSYDLLISDALSFTIMCREIENFYNGNPYISMTADYTEYLDYVEQRKNTKRYERDRRYWQDHINEIAPAPNVPTKNGGIQGKVFQRKEYFVKKSNWAMIKKFLASEKISPTHAVLGIYAAVIGFWCSQDQFTLNLPMTSQLRRKNGMDRIMGDFTESMLLTLPNCEVQILDYIRIVIKAFYKAYKHIAYDGVEVMRDLQKAKGGPVLFPIVFTGMISENLGFESIDFFGKMQYEISQTPQVQLDCQVFEANGELKVVWDYRRECFEEEQISEMFDVFIHIIENLPQKDLYVTLPERQKNKWAAYNKTVVDYSPTCLTDLIGLHAFEKFRISDSMQTLEQESFRTLAFQVASLLKAKGIKRGDRVAILGNRSIETVASMLGISLIGGVYVPLNPQYPLERQQTIVNNSSCKLCIDQAFFDQLALLASLDFEAADMNPDEEAYIIYTSGSTGTPKGVVISHGAVCNTILDINKRFNVNAEDRIVSVASFGFDLSVYDVWGSIASGAHLVIADNTTDIKSLQKTLIEKNITVWNSVPAMMGLLVDIMDENEINETLRLVLLSGDWIPPDLPVKIKKHFPNAEIISLGGATEGSIWSIYYPITRDLTERASIPYGYPLGNQQMVILAKNNQLAPWGVEGEIAIGGRGVALGYDADSEKTEKVFVNFLPDFGRIYRTGDYGVMDEEGYMVFRGRRDNQIKRHGYRVELGEIEQNISKIPNIRKAIVTGGSDGPSQDDNMLLAYIVPEEGTHLEERRLSEKNSAYFSNKKLIWEKQQTFQNIADYMNSMNTVALSYMNRLFDHEISIDALSEWMETKGFSKKFEGLLKNWLKILLTEGYFEKSEDGILKRSKLGKEKLETQITEIFEDAFTGMLDILNGLNHLSMRALQDYFMDCFKQHERLLREEVSPLALFYGENDEAALGIYRDNILATEMNEVLSETIGLLSKQKKDEPFRILEIGAGTGSTAECVLNKIDRDRCRYVFSDISDLFLNQSCVRLGDKGIDYVLLDMDQNFQSQGCPFGHFDVVLFSNALHDAADITMTLKEIKQVLKRDGWLILLETTKNMPIQMSTVGFLEGLNHCEDFRKNGSGPMLDSGQWQSILNEAGFRNVEPFLDTDEPGGSLWLNLFFAQNDNLQLDISAETIQTYLKNQLPGYMMPDQIFRLEEIPLTINGKIDFKNLPKPQLKKRAKNKVEPKTDMEKRLVSLWATYLDIEQPSVTDGFFEMGGDSLKAIRLVAMAEKDGVKFSLQDLYQYGTIRELAPHVVKITEASSPSHKEPRKEDTFHVSEEDMSAILTALQ